MNVHNYKHLYNLGQYQYIPPALPPHSLPITQLKYLYNFSQHTHPIHFLHTLTHMKSRETFPLTPPPQHTHTHTHTHPSPASSNLYTIHSLSHCTCTHLPPPHPNPLSRTHIYTHFIHMHKWLHSLSSTTEVTWVCCLSSKWRTPSTNIYLHTQHKTRLPTSGQKKEEVNLILPWKRVEAWHPLAARLSMLRWASGRRSDSQKMTQSGTLGCNLHQSRKHWAQDTDKGDTLKICTS